MAHAPAEQAVEPPVRAVMVSWAAAFLRDVAHESLLTAAAEPRHRLSHAFDPFFQICNLTLCC
jgi:hypothetical protein